MLRTQSLEVNKPSLLIKSPQAARWARFSRLSVKNARDAVAPPPPPVTDIYVECRKVFSGFLSVASLLVVSYLLISASSMGRKWKLSHIMFLRDWEVRQNSCNIRLVWLFERYLRNLFWGERICIIWRIEWVLAGNGNDIAYIKEAISWLVLP